MTKVYGISFATDNGKDEDDPNDTENNNGSSNIPSRLTENGRSNSEKLLTLDGKRCIGVNNGQYSLFEVN